MLGSPARPRLSYVGAILLGRPHAFEAYAVLIEEPPQGADASRARVRLEELGADLLQRQIRLLLHKLEQPRLVVRSQGRAAVPAAGLLAHALVPPALPI